MTKTIAQDIVEMILAGDLDSDMDMIWTAASTRRTVLDGGMKKNGDGDGMNQQDRERGRFRRGQKIRIVDTHLNPKYLYGKEFTVKKVNTKTVVVDFPNDPRYRRFSGAQNVRIPKKSVAVVA